MAKLLKTLVAISAAAAFSAPHAALVELGDGTVKDTDTNLIWLSNWMYDFNSNAQPCHWQCAVEWADGLAFTGETDWTLPTLEQYTTLWSNAGGSLAGLQTYFTNVQLAYWTSSDDTLSPSEFAWAFHTDSGLRDGDPKTRSHYATAVRRASMDVAEPSALVLIGIGLAILATIHRRRDTLRPAGT